jgi:hypothetical protein
VPSMNPGGRDNVPHCPWVGGSILECFFSCFLETGSHCVLQAGLALTIDLPHCPEGWDYRRA